MNVYRVQDRTGRGPFRPGFSMKWLDPILTSDRLELPPWHVEFGIDLIAKRGNPGEHFGSAVRTLDQLNRWFSNSELERLKAYGYAIVSLDVDRILAESPVQLVFARKQPLHQGAVIIQQQRFGLMTADKPRT